METVGLRVPALYIRELPVFNVCSSSKDYSSARCTLAANIIFRDIEYLKPKPFLLIRLYNGT
jgi:hypothetical protein